MCAYDFLGTDHLIFGTDAFLSPLQANHGTIHSFEKMNIPDVDREKFFEQNAVMLLKVAI